MLLCIVWHNMFIFLQFVCIFSYIFLCISPHFSWKLASNPFFGLYVFNTCIDACFNWSNFFDIRLDQSSLGYKFSWSDLCVNFHILFSFLFDSSYICTTTSCSYTTYDIGCFTWFYHGRVVVDHGYTVGTRIDPTYHG